MLVLQQATAIATHMVKEWGMSEKFGLRTVDGNSGSMFPANELGPSTTEVLDNEIKRILQESYDRAKKILVQHSKEHKALAEALIKYETLDADDVKGLLAEGIPIRLKNNPKDSSPSNLPSGSGGSSKAGSKSSPPLDKPQCLPH